MCKGKGRILSESARTRARQGGNASYLRSLEPGQLSMAERGRLGGQPKALTIDDIKLLNGRQGSLGREQGPRFSARSRVAGKKGR